MVGSGQPDDPPDGSNRYSESWWEQSVSGPVNTLGWSTKTGTFESQAPVQEGGAVSWWASQQQDVEKGNLTAYCSRQRARVFIRS